MQADSLDSYKFWSDDLIKRSKDYYLQIEIDTAVRNHQIALANLRNQRKNSNDMAPFDIEGRWSQYLMKLQEERKTRMDSGAWNPKLQFSAKKITAESHKPPPNYRGKHVPVTHTPSKSEGDGPYVEDEGVPVIVFEKGVPRKWRKGDPL